MHPSDGFIYHPISSVIQSPLFRQSTVIKTTVAWLFVMTTQEKKTSSKLHSQCDHTQVVTQTHKVLQCQRTTYSIRKKI